MEIEKRWPYPLRPTVVMRKSDTGTDLEVFTQKSPWEQPASDATILAHLTRVAMHLPVKGISKDSPDMNNRHSIEILKDYTQRLLAKKVTEVDLVIALDWFIENGKSEFFPSFAKLNAKLFGRKSDDDLD